METRQRILDEARELFLDEGLAGFSMRALAGRVGVTATALYRHFPDKDALLASLLGTAFGTFGSYLGRSLSEKTPLERFRAMGAAYIDFALEHPRDYQLMFLTNCVELGFSAIRKETDQRSQAAFEFLVERVQDCLQAGVFAKGDARAIAVHSWSSVHGVVSLWLLAQLRAGMTLPEFRQQAAFTLDRLTDSLLAAASPKPARVSKPRRR